MFVCVGIYSARTEYCNLRAIGVCNKLLVLFLLLFHIVFVRGNTNFSIKEYIN